MDFLAEKLKEFEDQQKDLLALKKKLDADLETIEKTIAQLKGAAKRDEKVQPVQTQLKIVSTDEKKTYSEMILDVLLEAGKPLAVAEICKKLEKNGLKTASSNLPTMVYNILKRLQDKEKVSKLESKKWAIA
jgi:hypothetical protein